jgi:hypothetical protein
MVSEPVCLGVRHLSGAHDQIFFTVRQLMLHALSDQRSGLQFTVAAGLRQGSHSRVRVPQES